MHEGKRTETETSKDHWSVVDFKSQAEEERIGVENREYFDDVLVKHEEWGAFFSKFGDLKLGEKIGEGGQAEIFASTFQRHTKPLVAKVFKKNVSLEDLERQWPRKVMSLASEDLQYPFMNLVGGAFIREGEYKNRFAFVMMRRWGDLRTLIDQRMLKQLRNCCNGDNGNKCYKRNKHGPPFRNYNIILKLICKASRDLSSLHEAGVVHRDVKASNLLIDGEEDLESAYYNFPHLMDFECSLGVVGTGFWRAPQILKQLQKRVPSHEVVFTKEADIYSFGMLCYEIITGRLPFEDHPRDDYSIVLRGGRPKLPDDLDPLLKNLILGCWQHDPRKRPSARDIYDRLFSAPRKDPKLRTIENICADSDRWDY
jgi:serine/threonine protein kinase